MISIKNITKRYITRELFSDVSFDVLSGERIGLVGRNGQGKTTLFRLITGEESPDEGRILKPKHYSIGYLGQHLVFTKPTVLEEACQGLKPDDIGAEWKVEKIMAGLGFGKDDMFRAPAEFSGGYQMRVALAKVLASEPNMLLLDEPTNFLDVVSIRWLEKFLHSWKGELIVISHDRDLVDSVTTHIVGIHRGNVRKMKGSTGKYYAQLQSDEALHEKRRVENEKERERAIEYINRFRSQASRAKGVQSSIKKLEKMEKLDKLEEIHTLSFSFNHEPLRAGQIMDVNDLTFSYDGKAPYLINGLNFTVNRHDKICVVGKNGKGKTTLLKLLSGRLKPASGGVKTHPAALPVYYEQANTAELDGDLTVEAEIMKSNAAVNKSRARSICGAMMFPGDDAEKKVRVLSGGERSRLLLGKLLVTPSNILFLDEPTHHLDIESCQAMADAVRDFEGAAIVVAHDEHLLKEVATKLIVFKQDRVFMYHGTYQEFLDRIGWDEDEGQDEAPIPVNEEASLENPEQAATESGPGPEMKPETKPDEKPPKWQDPKLARKAKAEFNAAKRKVLKPLEDRIAAIEKDIVSFEEEVKSLNREIADDNRRGGLGAIRRSEIARELGELTGKVDKLYEELETATTTYEAEKNKYSGNPD